MSAGGCGGPADGPAQPNGTVLAGRGPAFSTLLAQLSTLEGTPLARMASVLGERLAGCEAFFADLPPESPAREPAPLSERLRCVDEGPQDGPLVAALALLDDPASGAADWVWSHRSPRGGWLLRGVETDPGGHRISIRLPVPEREGGEDTETSGRWDLLLPAAADAGPARLAEGSLVHLRVRPDRGLDLASAIEAEGLADRLFRLRNELFLATALAGTWELAVYLPREGQRIPPLALALDAEDEERAVTAMEAFLAEVRRTWAVTRRPVTLAGRSGACLDDLNLMPELAPCYVLDSAPTAGPGFATGSLVVGWNLESIALALAPRQEPDATRASVARVHLDRLPEADARLARAAGGEEVWGEAAAGGALVYPWRTLTVEGRREGSAYELTARLEAAR